MAVVFVILMGPGHFFERYSYPVESPVAGGGDGGTGGESNGTLCALPGISASLHYLQVSSIKVLAYRFDFDRARPMMGGRLDRSRFTKVVIERMCL